MTFVQVTKYKIHVQQMYFKYVFQITCNLFQLLQHCLWRSKKFEYSIVIGYNLPWQSDQKAKAYIYY